MAETETNHQVAIDLLTAWLHRHQVSISKFAQAAGLDRVDLQKLLNGRRGRVGLITAYRIHHATGGVVPWWLWVPEDVRRTCVGSDIAASETEDAIRATAVLEGA